MTLNPLHLERAEAAVYPASSLMEVPEEFKFHWILAHSQVWPI